MDREYLENICESILFIGKNFILFGNGDIFESQSGGTSEKGLYNTYKNGDDTFTLYEKELTDAGCTKLSAAIFNDKFIGEWSIKIKEARENFSLSQADVDRLLGIPIRTIQDWEAGRRTPSLWLQGLVIKELARKYV